MDSFTAAGDGANTKPFYPVLIIGAGPSGIAMGCRLSEKMGFQDFKIFERQSGIGGTWWMSRYPGLASRPVLDFDSYTKQDRNATPSALYSFSFSPYYVSKTLYPTGPEFQAYLRGVAAKYEILDKIQLNTDVSKLRYIEEESEWEVTLMHLVSGAGDWSTRERQERIDLAGEKSVYLKEEVVRAKVVVSCVGVLVEPNPWPAHIPGSESFKGDIFHSARWPQDATLDGKDVVVIGSGSSAAQIVPSLLKAPYQVKSVTQIMRSAPWVMPRLREPFGRKRFARYAPTVCRTFPLLGFLYRVYLWLLCELVWAALFPTKNTTWRKAMERSVLVRMRSIVPERYHELMTPDHPYGCKRRIFDEEWLKSMNKPNFLLTNKTLMRVERNELVLRPLLRKNDGHQERESRLRADTIILANGYEATQWLHQLPIFERNGVSIHDVWKNRGGPAAYMLFFICGPNTVNGHVTMIVVAENIISYVMKIIRAVLNGKAEYAEVKKEAVVQWQAGIRQDMEKIVFSTCLSWYRNEKGYNPTTYPRSQTDFAFRCMFPKYTDWIRKSSKARKGV